MAILSVVMAFSAMSSATAASIADCISVTGGQFKKGIFDTTYEVTLRNACGDNFKELLNYSSISFYAGSSVLNPETDTIFYLQTYGQNYTFKLRNLKPGRYSPFLKIWSPKDYSSRTVYLPGFSILDPLNCVSVSESEFINDKFDPILRITVRNNCADLESSAFSGFKFSLNLPGYSQYLSSRSLFIISDYGSSLDFSLPDIRAGSYSPTLEISDNNYQTKRIGLEVFYVTAAPTPLPAPTKSSVKGKNGLFTQICATAKEFTPNCSDYPEFNFDLCSSLQKASLQEKVGSKWVFLWKVDGTKDSSVCSDARYPFYVLASGENKTGKKTELRLVFSKTSKVASYTQYFSLTSR